MIRQMKRGEEDAVRALIAKLSYENQFFWLKQTKPLEEYLEESSRIPIGEEVKGKNVILVAEEDGKIVGLCWCTIVDRGVDKQGEVVEFYVEREFRGKGIGQELIAAAKQRFIDEQVEVAFVWTHQSNKAAVEHYKNAGFKEVDQLVMAFVPSGKDKT
jgi:ribosomal protein S18 acetylase RimI-like enzyme